MTDLFDDEMNQMDELEFADEVTLGRSIVNRVPFESSIKAN